MKNLDRTLYYEVSGIYKIQSQIDSRCYIGSSKNLYKRINSHINELINKKHPNSKLQNFINKYGIECLNVEVLISNVELSDIYKLETIKIKEYKAFEEGFNLQEEAIPIKGRPLTSEHKEKIKATHIKNKDKNLPIYLKNLNLARKQVKLNNEILKLVGKKRQAPNKGIKASDETRFKQRMVKLGKPSLKKIKVNCLYKDGTFYKTYDSIQEAANASGANVPNICAVCKNKRKSTAGFLWAYCV